MFREILPLQGHFPAVIACSAKNRFTGTLLALHSQLFKNFIKVLIVALSAADAKEECTPSGRFVWTFSAARAAQIYFFNNFFFQKKFFEKLV